MPGVHYLTGHQHFQIFQMIPHVFNLQPQLCTAPLQLDARKPGQGFPSVCGYVTAFLYLSLSMT